MSIKIPASRRQRTTISQEEKVHNDDALAIFNNLDSGSTYRLTVHVSMDNKAGANNTVQVDLRGGSVTGTQIAQFYNRVMPSGESGQVANASLVLTGVSGTIVVRLDSSGTLQKNPNNHALESCTLEEVIGETVTF